MTMALQMERQGLTKISRIKPRINNQVKVEGKRDDEKVTYRAIEDYQRQENEG